jgi:GH43 family beta-xylosidase
MTPTYQNPLPIKNIGDPFVLRAPDGNYYCYATSAPDGFKAWTSVDLIHWRELGYIYKRKDDSWGESDFWAPEVVHYQGKYFMHYSARWDKNQSLRYRRRNSGFSCRSFCGCVRSSYVRF